MNKYYYTNREAYLAHYGVLGMKWNQHKMRKEGAEKGQAVGRGVGTAAGAGIGLALAGAALSKAIKRDHANTTTPSMTGSGLRTAGGGWNKERIVAGAAIVTSLAALGSAIGGKIGKEIGKDDASAKIATKGQALAEAKMNTEMDYKINKINNKYSEKTDKNDLKLAKKEADNHYTMKSYNQKKYNKYAAKYRK